jgi:hypothetical protein
MQATYSHHREMLETDLAPVPRPEGETTFVFLRLLVGRLQYSTQKMLVVGGTRQDAGQNGFASPSNHRLPFI